HDSAGTASRVRLQTPDEGYSNVCAVDTVFRTSPHITVMARSYFVSSPPAQQNSAKSLPLKRRDSQIVHIEAVEVATHPDAACGRTRRVLRSRVTTRRGTA